MTTALAGLRVLDLTVGPAGGVATMVLADFGAEVLHIERPSGDPFAAMAAAAVWGRGKHRETLDLKSSAGRSRLHTLAGQADVVVASFRPGAAERLGADYATLSAINPALVYCAITGWGPRGPYAGYKGYEALVAAKSGRMMTFAGQTPRPGPAYAAVQVGTHVVAQTVVQGVIAALLARRTTGRGQLVETSLLQGMLPFDLAGLPSQHVLRKFPAVFPSDPFAGRYDQPTLQYQPVLTKDVRWMQMGNLVEHLFHSFIAAAGLSDIYADERFTTAPALTEENREALRAIILERMREKTYDEWMEIFVADGNVAAEAFATTQAGMSHPQMLHNGHVVETTHPELGPLRQIGVIADFAATPGNPTRNASAWPPSPANGTHQSHTTPTEKPISSAFRYPRYPLDGVTVVEFAAIIAVPYACSILADLGARVIKVEPLEGDGLRNLGNGVSASKTTAGKESICLNLKSEDGLAIAHQLISRADILVHNYRPGVPERLGIGYADAARLNPDIVYVAGTGYGPSGPNSHRPSAHPVPGAAVGGVLWQMGAPPATDVTATTDIKEIARRLMRANELNPDPNTSMIVASAAMLGLYVQRTQGKGQRIETNMLIANAYANFDDFVDYAGKPSRPAVDEGLYGLGALYRLYPCREGWVFLACPFEQEWQALRRALADARLDDPRFATTSLRREHDAELAVVLSDLFGQRTADQWEHQLSAHDIGCVRADEKPAGVFWDTDRHAAINGFVRTADHARWGAYTRHGPLAEFGDTPARSGPGCLAGQHTNQILRELGYPEEQVHDLHRRGVVRTEML